MVQTEEERQGVDHYVVFRLLEAMLLFVKWVGLPQVARHDCMPPPQSLPESASGASVADGCVAQSTYLSLQPWVSKSKLHKPACNPALAQIF